MKAYYKVTYKKDKDLEVTYTRDTVERGYYLYKSLIEDDNIDNIKLEEVSDSGTILLRGKGCYEVIEIKKEEPKIASKPISKQPQTWFEMAFGITKEEYNECLANWNRLTGENVELL